MNCIISSVEVPLIPINDAYFQFDIIIRVSHVTKSALSVETERLEQHALTLSKGMTCSSILMLLRVAHSVAGRRWPITTD